MKRQTFSKVLKNAAVFTLVFGMLVQLLPVDTTQAAVITTENESVTSYDASYITELDMELDYTQYLDSSVVYQLPEGVGDDEEISVIVTVDTTTIMDAYEGTDKTMNFTEYALESEDAAEINAEIAAKKTEFLAELDDLGITYSLGEDYSTVLSGFEILIKAGDFSSACSVLGEGEDIIVGEVYETCETELVENEVTIYEDTGIFDTSDSGYDGSGMVVAVLDTGIDSNHTAFSTDNFTSENLGLTYEDVVAALGDTVASTLVEGLSVDDVYVSEKIPFAFDYADEDPDAYSTHNNHGNHVAGVIAGNDDTIVGVAPNAQIVSMKIFSDVMDTARSAWILSALEDCVILGVDVINMSLGTAAGFSRESDEEKLNGVYDKIREAGISVIAAASNSYSSAYGSDANGNLGLTSNPDTATVGSPSTYEGVMSVASISGTKTPYMLYDGDIIYFTESNNGAAEENNFVETILGDKSSATYEYVVVPGVGRSADYTGIDVEGKIALVRRGDNTFEEKALIAEEQGAAGIIIYNNVSGDIKMNVGDAKLAVASISQDDGERLVEAGGGKIKFATSQASGPFISDFSSWGPTPDLGIKPEITAHGGNILSALTGGGYERLSGTSMACPNLAGLVVVLRQYVEENFPDIADDNQAVTALVYQLLMSTADIALNTNGSPYSVRKQGAGLANLEKAIETTAYISTKDADGNEMDKTKIELGDDPEKTGEYELTFTINNFGNRKLSYNVDAYVFTEGVSETKTNAGETTVTEEAYILEGASVEVVSVEGGKLSGNKVTVKAGEAAEVTVKITLSDSDKEYLDQSFENGMYVEGFVTLEAKSGTDVDMSVPYLAFYGDWTVAPLFDLEYFDTHADELDDGIDEEDKTKADAYATRPIGGVSDDYVSYLGTYYFLQDEDDMPISADKDHISLSNQEGTIHSLRYVWAGLLRGAERIEIVITDDATGEVVFETTDYDVRKSYGDGGSIYPANIEIEFDAADYNFGNNTQLTATLTGYLDYGEDGGIDTNEKNTFTFPITIDFEAPTVTDVNYYYEYDKTTQKNRLYAEVGVYDNHYAMAAQLGYVALGEDENGNETPELVFFEQYLTPVYSERNGVTYVKYELTDYIYDMKENAINDNSFVVSVYDYALNYATYEIGLPDDYTGFSLDELGLSATINQEEIIVESTETLTEESTEVLYEEGTESTEVESVEVENVEVEEIETETEVVEAIVEESTETLYEEGTESTEESSEVIMEEEFEVDEEEEMTDEDMEEILTSGLTLSPNEVYTISPTVTPLSEWGELLDFTSSKPNVVRVVNNKLVAVKSGSAIIKIQDPNSGEAIKFTVTVLSEEDDDYRRYDKPVADVFRLTGFYTIKAYYIIDSNDKELGDTGSTNFFEGDYSLSMYPSESVALTYDLDAYFPSDTEVAFESSNEEIVTVDASGQVTAVAEGYASITVKVLQDGMSTYYSETVSVEVKDPYVTTGASLTHYYGNGGLVTIPADLSLTDIGSFAFSNFEYVAKTEEELAFDDAESTKQWYIGDSTITKVIIPEGVKTINSYAFANLTSLEEIVLPSTLEKIEYGAFYGCSSLKTITFSGDNNLKIISQNAFENCALEGTLDLSSACVISDYAFAGNLKLEGIITSDNLVSIGEYAFAGCKKLSDVTITSTKVKYGIYAFTGCKSLTEFYVNSAVLPEGMFYECDKLETVTIGDRVNDIGEFAFRDTKVSKFVVESGNKAFTVSNDATILSTDGKTIVAVAPSLTGEYTVETAGAKKITAIADGAFSHNTKLTSVVLPDVVKVGNYGLASNLNLVNIQLGELKEIGEYAFFEAPITVLPYFDKDTKIGKYAFAYTAITEVTIPDGMKIAEGVFSECASLTTVVVGNDVVLGKYAFGTNKDESFTILNYVAEDGSKRFYYDFGTALTSVTIGNDVVIGENAFANAASLETVVLGENAEIGYMAFYNATKLANIDLSKVKSIGDYAFSGDVYNVCLDDSMSYAAVSSEGTYVYSYHSPALTSVDLSSAESIGSYAFAYCRSLTDVVLGEEITEILEYTFSGCNSLTNINLGAITSIGQYAFMETGLLSADLSSAETVGEYAFVNSPNLASVILCPDGTDLDEGVFAYDTVLTTVENMGASENIGDYAFAYTALTSADLTNAVRVGTHAFMKEVLTPFTVTFGEDIESLGDNPFAMCQLPTLSSVITEEVNDTEIEVPTYTYEISDTVKVVDGAIYTAVPNGWELVVYTGSSDSDFTVAEDTVRISALAFAGTNVEMVRMPYTTVSIGHKAFYLCNNLHTVVSGSYNSPVLEEEYDPTYYETYTHIPGTGDYGTYTDYDGTEVSITGTGLIPYYMWNATGGMYSNVFYGANFVDYVGYVDHEITLVRPVNGYGYDSYIMNLYFGTIIDGPAAPNETTVAAINAIKAIPERVTYDDKGLVVAAREAYNKVASNEQLALVSNYQYLVSAEQRITAYESSDTETEENTVTDAQAATPEEKGTNWFLILVIIVALGILLGYKYKEQLEKFWNSEKVVAIREKVRPVWEKVKAVLVKIWEKVKPVLVKIWEKVKPVLVKIWEKVKPVLVKIGEKLAPIWAKIKEVVAKVWAKVKEVAAKLWEKAKPVLAKVWEKVKEVAAKVWAKVKEVAAKLWAKIKEVAQKVIEFVKKKIADIKTKRAEAKAAKAEKAEATKPAETKSEEVNENETEN